MEIHEDALDLLGKSSPNGVALAMNRVASNLNGGDWLSRSHRYRDRRGGRGNFRFKDDLSNRRVNADEMAEYIGVSAPVHSLDGWALLGRAIHSLLRGDPYSSVHLAYYAELRAALSLLATQGIGVFDRVHCVIDEKGDCTLVDALDECKETIGSHQWTWLVFQWWAEHARAVQVLGKVIQPGGEPLETWIAAMSKAQFALQQIGSEWLHMWGMDIGRYFADREARNLASYWPNTVNSWGARTAVKDFEQVAGLWLSLEPTAATRFASIDRHLLRIVLQRGYFGASGHQRTSQAGLSGLAIEVDSVIREMALGDSLGESWQSFLADGQGEPLAVIQLAGSKTKVGRSEHVVEVVARATMLLRVATGASAILLSESGIGRGDVAGWLESIGAGRGLWLAGNPPGDLVDLWRNVGEVMDDIEDVLDEGDKSRLEIWEQSTHGVNVFGECERVGLWGLGL